MMTNATDKMVESVLLMTIEHIFNFHVIFANELRLFDNSICKNAEFTLLHFDHNLVLLQWKIYFAWKFNNIPICRSNTIYNFNLHIFSLPRRNFLSEVKKL